MWDKIMRCPHGYFDGRAVMIGADALGLDGLLIARLDSAGFLVAVDRMTSPVADAKHLVFWDEYAHFEAIFPEEELYPVFPDVGEEFFFDGHAQAEDIVDVEELPPVADIVEELEKYLSTSRTNTRVVDEGGVATKSNAALASHLVGVAGGNASSSPAAILFAYVLLRSVMVFCRFSLLRKIFEALGFVVVLSRYIGCVTRGCMIRVEAKQDDRYTGFTPGLPGESRRCRLIRGTRYRVGTSSGLSRQALRRTVASVRQLLARSHPPPEPPACRWTNKSVMLGAVYIKSVMASALSYGFAIAPTIFVSMFIWATVGSVLKESVVRLRVETDPAWSQEDLDKWLRDTGVRREEAKDKFDEEQRRIKESKGEEAVQGGAQAGADAVEDGSDHFHRATRSYGIEYEPDSDEEDGDDGAGEEFGVFEYAEIFD
eukprot:g8831.t1